MYQTQLLEAKMMADADRIIGESLADNPLLLDWRQIKVYGEAAKGPNNVFIVPYDAMGPGQDGMLNSVLPRDGMDKNLEKNSVKQRGCSRGCTSFSVMVQWQRKGRRP